MFKRKRDHNFPEKISIIFGIISVPFIMSLYVGNSAIVFDKKYTFFDSDIKTAFDLSTIGWMISGFLIGLGSLMSSGLSGSHSYCSSPVLNRKNIIVTICSFLSAFTVATFRYYIPFFFIQLL